MLFLMLNNHRFMVIILFVYYYLPLSELEECIYKRACLVVCIVDAVDLFS